GPDLHREGGKNPSSWHYKHMLNPRVTSAGSIMPRYPWLISNDLDRSKMVDKIKLMKNTFDVPYTKAQIDSADQWADNQAAHIVKQIYSEATDVKKAYEDRSAFKLFLVDVGLLAAMGNIEAQTLLEGNAIFTEFKGALTEQYVFQQLNSANDYVIYYWSAERSSAEIDFMVQYNSLIAPIEVKAEENLQAKSLKVYVEKFSPKMAVRTSMSDFRKQDWLTNLPLYAISELKNV
ncbi:MAG: hypothetical protein B7Z24_01690, partial [Pseudomonadales bacterium 32-42-5]